MAAEKTSVNEEGENLVVNGDCNQGLTGWVDTQNAWQIYQNSFMPKSVASATMYQDVLIEDIPAGTEMILSANMYSFNQSPIDVGTLKLEFLNSDKTEVLSSNSVTHASNIWTVKNISMFVPEGAKYARISLHGDRHNGKDLDTHFKDISFAVVSWEKENKLKVVLEVNEKLQLSVEDDLSENLNITWISSDDSVATVDTNGVMKGKSPGNTMITVTSSDGLYTDTINVLVVDDAKDLRLAIDLKVGGSCRLTVDDLTETLPVIWSSLNTDIATVSDKGIVTAVRKGLIFITATDEEGNIIGQVYVRVRE